VVAGELHEIIVYRASWWIRTYLFSFPTLVLTDPTHDFDPRRLLVLLFGNNGMNLHGQKLRVDNNLDIRVLFPPIQNLRLDSQRLRRR
jgi:hypothetical protein